MSRQSSGPFSMRVAVTRAMKTATILMPTGRNRCPLI